MCEALEGIAPVFVRCVPRHVIRADVIRKEAWSFYRTISGVRLSWELEEPKGPKGSSQLWRVGALLTALPNCKKGQCVGSQQIAQL